MQTLSRILRQIALALLSGGSTAIVFAAITLVKAATAKGIPVAEAAATNSPVFIQYSKVAFAAAVVLAVGELIGFLKGANKTKLDYAQLVFSLGCIGAVCVFAFGIVPPMEQLLPSLNTVEQAKQQFHDLHKISEKVFGASILFAYISLILPAFKRESLALSQKPKETAVV
jgi:hypothetical protein